MLKYEPHFVHPRSARRRPQLNARAGDAGATVKTPTMVQLTVQLAQRPSGHRERATRASKLSNTSTTRLYMKPMRTDDESVLVVLDDSRAGGDDDHQGEEVDLVAHVLCERGYVGVVYGGYGLVWADAGCVVDWHWRDRAFAVRGGDGDYVDGRRPVVSSLVLGFATCSHDLPRARCPHIHCMSTTLEFFAGETLERLTLDRVIVTRTDLTRLLEQFPRLASLNLDRCVVESLEPLVNAYRRSPAIRLAALSLLGSRDMSMQDNVLTTYLADQSVLRRCSGGKRPNDQAVAWLAPLLDTLAAGHADVLRELHLDLMWLYEADQSTTLRRLAWVLSESTALTRLHVACRRPMRAVCAALLEPLRDVVLCDPPRVRRAVLSVLRAFGCGTPLIARVVLKQSEGSVVRTVTWSIG